MRYYLQYTPLRRGLTGYEYLAQYIDEVFNGSVKFYEVISNKYLYYGYLESEDPKLLSEAWHLIEGRFSAMRLFEEQFIGACYLAYNPIRFRSLENPEEETEIPFTQFIMSAANIEVTEDQALEYAKLYRRLQFKELIRKRFNDYNDLIADTTRIVTLLTVYKDELTDEEVEQLNENIVILKQLYPKEECFNALNQLLTFALRYFTKYKQAVMELNNATTKDEVDEVNLQLD